MGVCVCVYVCVCGSGNVWTGVSVFQRVSVCIYRQTDMNKVIEGILWCALCVFINKLDEPVEISHAECVIIGRI